MGSFTLDLIRQFSEKPGATNHYNQAPPLFRRHSPSEKFDRFAQ
jgi:hypothetical protein